MGALLRVQCGAEKEHVQKEPGYAGMRPLAGKTTLAGFHSLGSRPTMKLKLKFD